VGPPVYIMFVLNSLANLFRWSPGTCTVLRFKYLLSWCRKSNLCDFDSNYRVFNLWIYTGWSEQCLLHDELTCKISFKNHKSPPLKSLLTKIHSPSGSHTYLLFRPFFRNFWVSLTKIIQRHCSESACVSCTDLINVEEK
jgi:hypothetical protein